MDPFARKMWRAGFAFAGLMLVLLAALTLIYLHQFPKCPDRLVSETDSPSKKWVAAILERRCGAEAPFVTRVSLRRAGPLQRGFLSGQVEQGTVFAIEQDAAGAAISLVWSGNDQLIVRCAHCSQAFIRQRDQQWEGIKIRHEVP